MAHPVEYEESSAGSSPVGGVTGFMYRGCELQCSRCPAMDVVGSVTLLGHLLELDSVLIVGWIVKDGEIQVLSRAKVPFVHGHYEFEGVNMHGGKFGLAQSLVRRPGRSSCCRGRPYRSSMSLPSLLSLEEFLATDDLRVGLSSKDVTLLSMH
jgi:hypothetical protein